MFSGKCCNCILFFCAFYEYNMHQFIPLHWCTCLYGTSIVLNGATNEGNHRDKIWTSNKRWNWSSCTKLALSASWTHDLITQSVIRSELDSVVLGSIPFRLSFWKYTFEKPAVVNIIYTFLELNIKLTTDGELKTDLFVEPTGTHQFLDPTSSHPYHYKKGYLTVKL